MKKQKTIRDLEMIAGKPIRFFNPDDWGYMSTLDLEEKIIDEYKHRLEWESVSKNQTFTKEMIVKYQEGIDFRCLFQRGIITKELLLECEKSVNWYELSVSNVMPEDYIREFRHYIYWQDISRYQEMQFDFILDFLYEIDLEALKKNTKTVLTNEQWVTLFAIKDLQTKF